MAIAILFGGETAAFLDWPSVMIVIGGTVMVTLISFSIPEMVRAFGVVGKTVFYEPQNLPVLVKTLLEMAQKVRANGLLAIQRDVEKIPDSFTQKAITLAIDGHTAEVIERMLKLPGSKSAMANRFKCLKKRRILHPLWV
jgi:chemotaxis protein MotA